MKTLKAKDVSSVRADTVAEVSAERDRLRADLAKVRAYISTPRVNELRDIPFSEFEAGLFKGDQFVKADIARLLAP